MSSLKDTVGSVTSYVKTAKDSFSSATSSLSGNKEAASGSSTSGKIPQSERAFTVRPRSTPLANQNKYTSDRGPIASIKLITDQPPSDVKSQISRALNSTSSSGVDEIVDALLGANGYSDFLLTNVDVSFTEKVQVNEVFGDSEVVYYFGRSPIQFNFSGVVFDDVDNNWFYKFVTSYFAVLRGTQLAKNHQLAQINLPNMTVVGTITGMTYSQDSSRDTDIRFTMQFLAKSITPRPSLVPSELLNNKALVIDLKDVDPSTFSRFHTTATINNIKRQVDSARAYLGSTLGAGQNSVTNFLNNFSGAVTSAIDSAKGFFDNSLTGIFSVANLRANLLSPVYGVLTTLTKVVKSITGSVLSLFSAGNSIIGGILQDVNAISNEALALVNAIEGGVNDIVTSINKSADNLRRTIQGLKNATGAISRVPENVSHILKRLSLSGNKGASMASLKSSRRRNARIALLRSGSGPGASNPASLTNNR